jgi:hypothetical protein
MRITEAEDKVSKKQAFPYELRSGKKSLRPLLRLPVRYDGGQSVHCTSSFLLVHSAYILVLYSNCVCMGAEVPVQLIIKR